MGDKIVDIVLKQGNYKEEKNPHTPSPPSIQSWGDGGGKALLTPLEVSKVSESTSRANCLN